MQKRFLIALVLILNLLPASGQAQLQDADPKNFFSLLEGAPWVGRVSIKSAQAPKAGQRFFLHQLKVAETLKGEGVDRLLVLDEPLTPGAPALLPGEGEFLVFLGPLPNYTAYQEARRQGYEHRVLGGKSGVVAKPEAAVAVAKDYLAGDASRRGALLLQALRGDDLRLANDAAIRLGERSKTEFSSADVEIIVGAVRERPHPSHAKIALVRALENSGNAASLEGLKQLADDPPSPAKWAAVRALDRLGAPRPMDRLAEDFRRADDAEKSQALALIVPQKSEAAEAFLSGVLAGPFSMEVKKSALRRMAEHKSPGYEALLLKNLGAGEATLRAETVLTLGRMGSSQAVPLVIPLLDSPLAPLRAAAFLMLSESPDPRAREVISHRYTRDHHGGVWEQNQHFYEGAGTGQKP